MRKTKEIKSKISAVRNSFTDNKKNIGDNFENYVDDLKSQYEPYAKKLDEFKNKRKKKKESKKDIFSELLEIVENFISIDDSYSTNDKFQIKQKIKRYANESMKLTIASSKEIIQNAVKKTFFAGEDICGANSKIPNDSITIKPREIDFLSVLTIEPTSNVGQIVYEPSSPDVGKQKVNRKLFDAFNQGAYSFKKNDGGTLFTATWNAANQEYQITGLKQSTSIEVNEFFNDYFSSIEMPDFTGITKTAILLTIQGDGSESVSFKTGLNNLERILKKLFAVCGTPTKKDIIKNQNPKDLFDENDEIVEDYFDFDTTDEIDFEKEDEIFRSVLKFRDCNNFEIPVNKEIIEDFVYLISKKSLDDIVDETLEKQANDANEQSNGSVPTANFNLNLINNFILNLPKALILNVLSPKVFLPIVLIYKSFKVAANQIIETKDLMKKLSKLFYTIIKELFWKFIREFWVRIKAELLNFVKKIIIEIKKGKYKRYVDMVKSIIESLRKLNINDINSCEGLFGTILQTIEKATTAKGSFVMGVPNIPGIILQNSDVLPGLTKQKLLIDAVQYLENNNISTSDVFGNTNNLVTILDAVFDSLIKNLDKYSYVKGSNKFFVMPGAVPIPMPPGTINFTGKLF